MGVLSRVSGLQGRLLLLRAAVATLSNRVRQGCLLGRCLDFWAIGRSKICPHQESSLGCRSHDATSYPLDDKDLLCCASKEFTAKAGGCVARQRQKQHHCRWGPTVQTRFSMAPIKQDLDRASFCKYGFGKFRIGMPIRQFGRAV